MNNIKIFMAAVILSLIPLHASAEFITSFQAAGVFTQRNDAALPGDTGTKFSYKDDLNTGAVVSPRIEVGYMFAGRHYIGFMESILRIQGNDILNRDIMFDGKLFRAGTLAEGKYRFDSYRGTYRYMFFENESIKAGAGVTGKIRSAKISLESGGEQGSLSNTGFVPLINYYLEWIISPAVSLLTYGDAAWSPYGRAEDIFAGGLYRFNNNIAVMSGYRLLEGGADNDKVYTFGMFHYAVMGVELRF